MLKRIRGARPQPEPPPPPPPPPPPGPLDSLLERLGLPGAIVRQVLRDMEDLRPYWPILIPAVVIVALRTYRRERAQVLAARRERRARSTVG